MAKRKDRDTPSFADAMATFDDVEPIDRDKIAKHVPAPGPRSSKATLPSKPGQAVDPIETKTPAPIAASRAELKRLRAGKIRPQRTIDLHGFTRDNAYRRLCNEIARAATSGLRCVLVIHGKGLNSSEGSTTIKESLADWIAQPPLVHQVTGRTLAQPQDGGGGASYLLLR